MVIRLAAPLFFANGSSSTTPSKRAVDARRRIRHLVLDMEAVTDIDVTGAEAFDALQEWLHGRTGRAVLQPARAAMLATRMRATSTCSATSRSTPPTGGAVAHRG